MHTHTPPIHTPPAYSHPGLDYMGVFQKARDSSGKDIEMTMVPYVQQQLQQAKQAGSTYQWVVVLAGINDLGNSNKSAAAIMPRLTQVCYSMRLAPSVPGTAGVSLTWGGDCSYNVSRCCCTQTASAKIAPCYGTKGVTVCLHLSGLGQKQLPSAMVWHAVPNHASCASLFLHRPASLHSGGVLGCIQLPS